MGLSAPEFIVNLMVKVATGLKCTGNSSLLWPVDRTSSGEAAQSFLTLYPEVTLGEHVSDPAPGQARRGTGAAKPRRPRAAALTFFVSLTSFLPLPMTSPL